jgi:predicted enzyme related to lactoylglutathione lyase
MIQGLRTVVYYAPDLAQAKAWYSKVLDVKPYFDERFYVGFNVGGFELGLDPDGRHGRGSSTTYWGVANAKEAVARLVELGATVEEEVAEVGGGIKTATVIDPFGNVFGVIENPHFDASRMQ